MVPFSIEYIYEYVPFFILVDITVCLSPMAFMEKTVCTYLMESGYILDDRWNVLHKDFYSKLEELCK